VEITDAGVLIDILDNGGGLVVDNGMKNII